ncbi:Uncharacterized protein APZ42_002402 [Daphnia magna]|uniref:Uncharacterized protein n=1 Tax=Daphnia magna TaxID=35525 RepID=A0A164IA98_9CRUS|nr:Uncharacterized protein APZ42_002402 [Daphnia magna]
MDVEVDPGVSVCSKAPDLWRSPNPNPTKKKQRSIALRLAHLDPEQNTWRHKWLTQKYNPRID